MGAAAKRGRRPDPAKDAAILEAASAQFLNRGYTVSIDDIAAAAGVSKQTVYARFACKEDLLAAVVRASADELTGALFEENPDVTPAQALTELGMRYQDVVLDPRRISLQRLLIAQAQQFPELASRFFESGPGYIHERLAQYIEKENEKGRLKVEDPGEAAQHFLGLIKGSDQLLALLGLDARAAGEPRKQKVIRAVDAFLKIYGA